MPVPTSSWPRRERPPAKGVLRTAAPPLSIRFPPAFLRPPLSMFSMIRSATAPTGDVPVSRCAGSFSFNGHAYWAAPLRRTNSVLAPQLGHTTLLPGHLWQKLDVLAARRRKCF